MISIRQKGDWSKTTKFLKNAKEKSRIQILSKYGELGVQALQISTPKDTGETAKSWYYRIGRNEDGNMTLSFHNRHIEDNIKIAVILQFGHVTGTGGYVTGVDYINPALKPIFDELADKAWKEIVNG